MKYDAIIIGGGAAGLFYAANAKINNGLILEASEAPGRKLLMSGAGQCNLTHGGSIKDFIGHYGPNGKKVRSALYKVSNLKMQEFFESHGIPMTERDDGKIFPESMRASDVLKCLMHLASANGWKLMTGCRAEGIKLLEDGFLVNGRHEAEKLIIACGGCSIPSTGSDGSIFPALEALGLEIVPLRPALVPLTVQDYPYSELSGISFKNALVTVDGHRNTDDVLLTHSNFSGPGILNLSRYAKPGSTLTINYLGKEQQLEIPAAEKRIIQHWLTDSLWLPKRFVEAVLARAGVDPKTKANQLPKKQRKAIEAILMRDTFSVSGTTGFKNAMVTSGGVALNEVDMKTFEAKKIRGLYIIGETLDVDGDTGGYNLQFAFSSAVCAAEAAGL
ncbi:MAG: aminoacetone oxidase family FAD-binding enzyme [Firmicutes bacterium]|nr:aminoacetone oxidase family FAD-binding enzyme [Bacillota bacterium]